MSDLAGDRKPRLLSLDVFRGATVAGMILVNNPGDWGHVFWPLDHSEWNGCTPTDLVMPFFLFIVGVSIVYAMDSRSRDRAQHASLVLKTIRRTFILLLLGWLLAFFPASPAAMDVVVHHTAKRFAELRIMGVLQRIALVYFICALLMIKTGPRVWAFISAVILIGYWAVMTLVPVPDCHVPGGCHPPSLEASGNIGAWIDVAVLGQPHLYKGADFDPEGLLSTLSAVSTGLLGMLAGFHLKNSKTDPATKVAWLFSAGLIAAVVGWTWGLFFPLNKQLWTGSFSLTTSGMAAMFLAAAYWLIDINRMTRGTAVFRAFGVNAITAFVASGLLARLLMLHQIPLAGKPHGIKHYLYFRFLAPHFHNAELASFTGGILYVLIWAAMMLFMEKRRWIVKV
jgi:predicted acyltransferase